MLSSHRIPTIALSGIFIWAIQQVSHLGRRGEKTKKATENYIEKRKARSQKRDVPHTNSSMYFFL